MANPALFAMVGAGGMGREAMSFFKRSLRAQGYEVVFVDDRRAGQVIHGVPCRAQAGLLDPLSDGFTYNVAIGSSRLRESISHGLVGGHLLSLVHESAFVGDGVSLGPGAIVCPGSTVTVDVRVGRMFQCNVNCHIAHDCVIGDYVTLAPGVHLNGNVIVEDHAYIGAGAVLKQGSGGSPLVIGPGAVVGMGAVVTRSVPAGTTVVGNPARALGE